MGYRSKPRRHYSPAARKWAARAFRQGRSKVKRYLVHYEAVVNGEAVTDALYVLASSEKEALTKARNVVKSFHPKAKGIVVAVKEEHILSTWKPSKKYSKLIEKSNQYWLANRRE